MDRVSTEIAEKVGMLFQHYHVHAHTGQEETQHHAGRAASRDTTARAHADIMENYLRTGNCKLVTEIDLPLTKRVAEGSYEDQRNEAAVTEDQ
jgi:ABC-type polar amino acid transport system ATPase subunit